MNPGFTRAYTATTLIPRFRVVAADAGGDRLVKLATSVSDPLLGIIDTPRDVPLGEVADVALNGILNVEAGGNVARMAWVTVDSQGRVVTAGETDEVIGQAHQAAVAGDVIEVEILKQR